GPAPAHCGVWRIDLDQPMSDALRALLSPAERARKQRFVFARDRNRFGIAHVALRELLAQRTGRDIDQIELTESPLGKPMFATAGPPGPAAPYFNLSHSQGLGVIALSDDHEVGVDVEVLRPMPDRGAMARTYFTPAERATLERLESLGALAAERAFFTCWTRKEACLKALGLGLQLATDSFEVGVDARAGEACELDIETLDGVERLRLQSFDCGADGVGALALRMPRDTPPSVSARGDTHAPKTSV
ncbi:MAG TPA: 4'-phosphopantetheinyl transferase superfamily protein, partial [Variovorax sp.]|nr:4'-phosphopantetheinyl transferase superfamily protein [Variovorax sp.]